LPQVLFVSKAVLWRQREKQIVRNKARSGYRMSQFTVHEREVIVGAIYAQTRSGNPGNEVRKYETREMIVDAINAQLTALLIATITCAATAFD